MNSYKWALSIALLGALLLSACQPVMPVETADEAINEVKRVLLIVREGAFEAELMVENEVGVMRSMLEEAGYEVDISTETGWPITSWGKPILESDLKLADVEVNDYVGVMIACMAADMPGYIPEDAIEIVKAADAMGMPVAAQHGAVSILGASGVLDGKNYAYGDDLIPEGTFMGQGVVQDENIFTSGQCPYGTAPGREDGTEELTLKVIQYLN